MEARQLAEESLNPNQALGYQFGIVLCMVTRAYICLAQGAYEEAHAFSSEGLAISRNILGDPQGTAASLTVLSTVANRLGLYAEAKQWAEEGIQISKTINDLWGLGILVRQLGLIHLDLGATMQAQALIRQSVSQFREIGDRTGIRA